MAAHLSEEEQIEAIKRWWKDNGKTTIAAIVLGVGGFWGWNLYQDHRESQAQQGATMYEEFTAAVAELEQGESTEAAAAEVRQQAEALIEHDASSFYADFARLYLARLAVEQEDYATAQTQLQQVVSQGANETVQNLARLRLARVMAAGGELEQALTLLTGVDAGSYASAYAETRGDILMQLDRLGEARTAYQDALGRLSNPRSMGGSLIQLKLENTRLASDDPELPPAGGMPNPHQGMNPSVPNPNASDTDGDA